MSEHRSARRWLTAVGAGLATALLLAPLALADFAARDWRYFKRVVVPASGTPGQLAAVIPDAELFAGAEEGLRDVRIVEEPTGLEVPYHLVVQRGASERTQVRASLRDLGAVPGQYSSFIAEVSEVGALHNEIEILTASTNFRRRVTVEGSADASTWAVLQDGQDIFDITDSVRALKTRLSAVTYSATRYPYLRVRIENKGEQPLEITGANIELDRTTPPEWTERTAAILARVEDAEQRVTHLIVDLERIGIPSSRLAIRTDAANFSRDVTLATSPDARHWRSLGSVGSIYSYRAPGLNADSRTVEYSESRDRFLRVIIHNGDNPPLPISGVDVWGIARKLVFPSAPEKAYRLYYGAAGARTPSYEFERVFPDLNLTLAQPARLGDQQTNPLYVGPVAPEPPFTERFPWLVPTAVAVAAALVGGLLYRVLLAARSALPPPEE